MELICNVLNENGYEIRPAPVRREWMDATRDRFAYRCLPLSVANGFGWEILLPVGFTAIWNGGQAKGGLVVMADPGTEAPAYSHFGEGILTFAPPYVFRTDPGTDLIVQGPINRPKDAIAPLTGIVESDWGSFSFTMNWRFTRPKTAIRFKKGEPFCHIFPVQRGSLEQVDPVKVPIAADPDLKEVHEEWITARRQFNEDLKDPGSAARAEKWQKHYQRGVTYRGEPGPDSHRIRTKLKPFRPVTPGENPDD